MCGVIWQRVFSRTVSFSTFSGFLSLTYSGRYLSFLSLDEEWGELKVSLIGVGVI
jgi:hypothetical protein